MVNKFTYMNLKNKFLSLQIIDHKKDHNICRQNSRSWL